MDIIGGGQYEGLLALASAWVQQQEREILQNGAPLSEAQISDARLVPVESAEKVRLLKVDEMPLPDEPRLRQAAQMTGFIGAGTVGLTMRYGVFIAADVWEIRDVVVHELAHVAQYERLGGIRQFLERYLYECMFIGYPGGPMEQEAMAAADRICGRQG
jgi:hypothetical protein